MRFFKRYSRKPPRKEDLVNKDIRFFKIMVIGPNGSMGEMTSRDGIKKAQELGLDLVCISPKAKPPICKIIDYGKYKFAKTKKTKESRKKRSFVILKEVRITPNIGQQDLITKAKKALGFLKDKAKVKVSLKFRGRERAHMDVGKETLMRFFDEVKDIATIEKPPYTNGRFYDMIITPNKITKKHSNKSKLTSTANK